MIGVLPQFDRGLLPPARFTADGVAVEPTEEEVVHLNCALYLLPDVRHFQLVLADGVGLVGSRRRYASPGQVEVGPLSHDG